VRGGDPPVRAIRSDRPVRSPTSASGIPSSSCRPSRMSARAAASVGNCRFSTRTRFVPVQRRCVSPARARGVGGHRRWEAADDGSDVGGGDQERRPSTLYWPPTLSLDCSFGEKENVVPQLRQKPSVRPGRPRWSGRPDARTWGRTVCALVPAGRRVRRWRGRGPGSVGSRRRPSDRTGRSRAGPGHAGNAR